MKVAAVLHGCEANVGETLDGLTLCGEPGRPYLLNGHKHVWCCDPHAVVFGPALEPVDRLAR